MVQRFSIVTGVATLALTASVVAQETVPTPEKIEHVSCDRGDHEIRLRINGVKKGVGLVTAELYRNDPDNFLRGAGRISKTKFAAKAPQTQFCIQTPGPGDYALVVYHDQNANHHIDKGAFGIPTEPWAISNNPKIRFGPPKIEEALFEVNQGGVDFDMSLQKKTKRDRR